MVCGNFDSNGNILSKESYSNGLLNGDVIYYFNGIITELYEYLMIKKWKSRNLLS